MKVVEIDGFRELFVYPDPAIRTTEANGRYTDDITVIIFEEQRTEFKVLIYIPEDDIFGWIYSYYIQES